MKEIVEWNRKLDWALCVRVKAEIGFLFSTLNLSTNAHREPTGPEVQTQSPQTGG